MPTPVTTVEMGSPIHHWQGCPFPPIITVLLFLRPPRQLLPPSLEPIKRIKNPCTRNHLLNTLALLLLYKNNPSSTRKPDEVQPCSSLPCPAWKRGVSLAHLLVTASPAASGGEEPLSGGERRGARPECWRQIRSQRKEWKPVIFYTFFDGENRTFFWTCFLLLASLSGTAHSECGPSALPGGSFSAGLLPGPQSCSWDTLGCRRLGHPPRTTRDRGNQGPGCSCWSLVPGLALSPLSLILDSRTFGTQWNHHFKAKRN